MKKTEQKIEEIMYDLAYIKDNNLSKEEIKVALFMCSRKIIDLAFKIK